MVSWVLEKCGFLDFPCCKLRKLFYFRKNCNYSGSYLQKAYFFTFIRGTYSFRIFHRRNGKKNSHHWLSWIPWHGWTNEDFSIFRRWKILKEYLNMYSSWSCIALNYLFLWKLLVTMRSHYHQTWWWFQLKPVTGFYLKVWSKCRLQDLQVLQGTTKSTRKKSFLCITCLKFIIR